MSEQLIGEQVVAAELSGETDNPTPEEQRSGKRLNRRQLIVRRFLRNKTAVVGLVVFLLLALLAIVGPYVTPWGWDQIDDSSFLSPPSASHWLGTTQEGRDVLALTIKGLSKSMLVGVLVALLSTSMAALVGSVAAYFGMIVEKTLLWIIDLLLVIPSFLIIAVISTGGPQGAYSWLLLVLLLAAFGWMLTARVVRSLTLALKDLDYVQAARFMSVPAPTIIVRHILPNISSLLVVDATLNVGGAILGETGLSYFGFGIQPPDTSLGTLIADGQSSATVFPWIFLSPAILLVIIVLSVNAIGDGLRDALDPNSGASGRAM
ncbi:peptide/nickel transport system permease protein [Friedmanniella endophytica]|uniref:Oligopeptide transport system permease protein OppC n=1 Tax=Microlunatus kandeliicorticis TaxID=1759536 RepID=A0A7W3ISU7_9ACTN|nr:ABC transporter permease [Microlunatus kandeliicorticis]MBA8794601.1 peptide/nickel transport system permease protein [Microlunatus kandeliicorticis]